MKEGYAFCNNGKMKGSIEKFRVEVNDEREIVLIASLLF